MQILIFLLDSECLFFIFGKNHDFIGCEFGVIGISFNFLGEMDLAFTKLYEMVFFILSEIKYGIEMRLIFKILMKDLRFLK